LDESGVPDPISAQSAYFPYFILSGTVIEGEEQSEKLKIFADQIKYKYWNNKEIVFHSREIGRRENDFSVLKNPDTEQAFHKDIIDFLHDSSIKCIIIIVDKEKAQKLGWTKKDVYEKSTDKMIAMFIEFLQASKGSGRIIIESAGAQKDIIFYKNYVHYLAAGMPTLGLDHKATKKLLTSISFVSKNNRDIESQIADLLAYPAGYQCLVDTNKKKFIEGSYETKMCKVLGDKLITIGQDKSFVTLP